MEVDVVEDSGADPRELTAVLQRDEEREVAEANQEMLSVIRSLGSDQYRYHRERQKALKAVVSDIYFHPRVTAAIKLLPELRLVPGITLDFKTADTDGSLWDFDSKAMRKRAMRKVRISHVRRAQSMADDR